MSTDQYAQLRRQKKRRKQIESSLEDHWEFGEDGQVFEHAVTLEVKQPSKATAREKRTTVTRAMQSRKRLGHAQASGEVELVSVSESAQETYNKRRKRGGGPPMATATATATATDTASISTGEIDENLRPLEEWMLNYGLRTGASTSELHNEAVESMQVDAAAAAASSSTRTAAKSKVQFGSQQVRARTPKRRTTVNREKEEPHSFDEFFAQDPTPPEAFGQDSASDYAIFDELARERQERDQMLDDQAQAASGNNNAPGLELPRLEECSRAYCGDFLREPMGAVEQYGERQCSSGKNCIFFLLCTQFPDSAEEISPDNAFVCREFLLPSQLERWEKERVLPEERQLCLGCNRLLTTHWYYRYLSGEADSDTKSDRNQFKSWIRRAADKISPAYQQQQQQQQKQQQQRVPEVAPAAIVESLQDHFNTVDSEGGYKLEYCLYPNLGDKKWLGISRPIVEFSADTYKYAKMTKNSDSWTNTDTVLGLGRLCAFREEQVKNLGSCEITIPTNIPRLLLRRHLEGATHESCPIINYMLCPFMDTVKAVREQRLRFSEATVQRIRASWPVFGFGGADDNTASVDAVFGEDAKHYCVLSALVYRLYICHCLQQQYASSDPSFAEFLSPDVDLSGCARKVTRGSGIDDDGGNALRQHVLYMLHLFLDTHLGLCDYIARTGLSTDDLLESAEHNVDDLTRAALEQYMPSDMVAAHAGALPDLTPCIDMGNIWYDVRPKPRTETIICAVIHIIACKTQNHKCQLRNFMRILRGYFCKYPPMIRLFRMIIEVSLLGNYPHARYRPSLRTRVRLHSSLRSDELTDEALFLWMHENHRLIYYVTKEYYVHMVSVQHALERVLCETGRWAEVKRVVVGAMDAARMSLEEDDGFSRESCFERIDSDMTQMHQRSLSSITKLRKHTFLEMMVHEMAKVHERLAVTKDSTAVQTSEMLLARIMEEDDDAQSRLYTTLYDMQLVVDERFPGGTPVELRWLKCFGIGKSACNAVRRLYYDYECRDIADNTINSRLASLYRENPRDFHLVHVFFRMVGERHSLSEHRLSADYALNQRAALRARYFVPPWKELPACADLFNFCTICRRWLSPVVDPVSRKGAMNIYAQGPDKALYDHSNDLIFCGLQSTSIGVRKLLEAGVYSGGERTTDPKSARVIRRHREMTRCCQTPLGEVHMIGVCKRLGGKFWALCELCGALTQWEGAKFSHLGFTCERHARRPVQVGAAAGGSSSSAATGPARCFACNELVVAGSFRTVKILDDGGGPNEARAGKFKYRTVYFCQADYDRCRWFFEREPGIVRKSRVVSTISKFRRGNMKKMRRG